MIWSHLKGWVTCLLFGNFIVECERLSVLFGITLRDWLLSYLLWRSKNLFLFLNDFFSLQKQPTENSPKLSFLSSEDIECLTKKQPIDFLCWNHICQEEARLLVFVISYCYYLLSLLFVISYCYYLLSLLFVISYCYYLLSLLFVISYCYYLLSLL